MELNCRSAFPLSKRYKMHSSYLWRSAEFKRVPISIKYCNVICFMYRGNVKSVHVLFINLLWYALDFRAIVFVQWESELQPAQRKKTRCDEWIKVAVVCVCVVHNLQIIIIAHCEESWQFIDCVFWRFCATLLRIPLPYVSKRADRGPRHH